MTWMREWFVRSEWFRGDTVDFMLVERRDGTVTHTARSNLTLEPTEPGAFREPTFSISRPEAQQLMNGLWQAGFRPNDGQGAIAHVETLKAHLDDLRTVAFHALRIKPPSR